MAFDAGNTVELAGGNGDRKVSGLASDLTGKPVMLPAITSADPPQSAVNKLSGALGVSLPANFGQITLLRSSDLATVQKGV